MAQHLLLRAIKKQVSTYTGDLEGQVSSGKMSLSRVELRPRKLLQGLWLFGKIGEVSAEWNWKRLLTSQFEVCLTDVCIVVRLPPQGFEWPLLPEAGDGAEATASAAQSVDPAEDNFAQRLKKRIWDRLRIKVANLHIRIECYGGKQTELGAWMGSACGFVSKEFAVSPREAAPGQPIWQTVSLSDAGLFVAQLQRSGAELPTLANVEWPSEESMIICGLSPYCAATRHGGRRFVDWRGLEVDLHITAPKIQCTRQNWHDLIAMSLALSGPAFTTATKATSATSSSRSREDSCGESSHLATVTESDTWRGWFGSLWSNPDKQMDAVGTRLPAGVSELDREMLLEEEREPDIADTFKLTVEVETAHLQLPDVKLAAMLSCGAALTFFQNSWELVAKAHEVDVREGALVAGATMVCSRWEKQNAVRSVQPPPILKLQGTQQDGININVELAPLAVRISQHVVAACKDAMDVLETVFGNVDMLQHQRPHSPGSASESKEIKVSWKADGINVELCPDVMPSSTGPGIVTHLEGSGSHSRAGGTHTMSMDLELHSGRQVRQILEPFTMKVGVTPVLVAVACEPWRSSCRAQDYLLVLQAAKCALSSYKSCSTSTLRRGLVAGSPSHASDASRTFTVEVRSMNIVVLDDAEETEWVCCLEPISVKVQRSDVVCYMPKASLSNELTGTRAEWQASMDLSWASGVPEGICAVAELQIVEAPSMTAIVSRSQGDKPGAMIMVHINDSQSGEARASMLDITVAPRSCQVHITKQTVLALQRLFAFIATVKSTLNASTVECTASPASSSKTWALRWRQKVPLELCVGESWVPGIACTIDFIGEGAFGHKGNFEVCGKAGLCVQEQAHKITSRWIEPTPFLLDIQPTKCTFEYQALSARCALLELLPVLRAVRKAVTEDVQAGDRGKKSTSMPTVQVSVCHVRLHIADIDNSECLVQGHEFEFSWAGLMSWRAKSLEASMMYNGALRGTSKVDQPLLTLLFEENATMNATLKSGAIKLLDGEGHIAVAMTGLGGKLQLQLLAAPSPSPLRLEGAFDGSTSVDTTKEFLLDCKSTLFYVMEAIRAIWIGEPLVFTERPVGLRIANGKVVDAGAAAKSGVEVGWHVSAVDPPPPEGVHTSDYFRTCSLPIVVLFEAPPRVFQARVNIQSFPLTASLRTRFGLEVGLEKASIACPSLQLIDWLGTGPELSEKISAFYLDSMRSDLPQLVSAACIGGVQVRHLAKPLLVSLAVGGNVVKGLSTALKDAAEEGRQQRGAGQGYKFGDVTRGSIALAADSLSSAMKKVPTSGGRDGERSTSFQIGDVARGSFAVAAEGASQSAAAVGKAGSLAGNVFKGLAEDGKKARGDAGGKYQFGDVTKGFFDNLKRRKPS